MKIKPFTPLLIYNLFNHNYIHPCFLTEHNTVCVVSVCVTKCVFCVCMTGCESSSLVKRDIPAEIETLTKYFQDAIETVKSHELISQAQYVTDHHTLPI